MKRPLVTAMITRAHPKITSHPNFLKLLPPSSSFFSYRCLFVSFCVTSVLYFGKAPDGCSSADNVPEEWESPLLFSSSECSGVEPVSLLFLSSSPSYLSACSGNSTHKQEKVQHINLFTKGESVKRGCGKASDESLCKQSWRTMKGCRCQNAQKIDKGFKKKKKRNEERSRKKQTKVSGLPYIPLLFLCAIEVLAILIRGNDQIKGLKVGDQEKKVSLLADDTTCFVQGDQKSFTNLFDTLCVCVKHLHYKFITQ